MKKFGKKGILALFGICILLGIAVPVALSQKARARAQEDEELTLFADVIVIKYRETDGRMQFRRWNETKGVWVDEDWMDLTQGTPTQGADLTGIPGAVSGTPGLTNAPSPTPTGAPSPTPEPTTVPGPTPTPLPTGMPEQKVAKADSSVDLVPLDEGHFSDKVFRAFLSANYDADRDGFLSRAERENLIWLDWSDDLTDQYYGDDKANWRENDWKRVFDGLDWFPRLERVYLQDCSGVVYLIDHPSIQSFSVCEGGGDIWAENCDRLESISYMYAAGVVYARDCKNLNYFGGEDAGEMRGAFWGTTPLLEFNMNVEFIEDAPASDFIPVDEEHFGAAAFCAYLKEKFDTDGDGMLSNKERYKVHVIDFLQKETYEAMGGGELKGFTYFRSLERLTTDCGIRILVERHQNLKYFCAFGSKGSVGEIRIEDCPALEKIVCYEASELYVKNCVSLTTYQGTEQGATFLYTPRLVKGAVLTDVPVDGDVFFDISGYAVGEIPVEGYYSKTVTSPVPFMVSEKEGIVTVSHPERAGISWNNLKKDSISIAGDFPKGYLPADTVFDEVEVYLYSPNCGVVFWARVSSPRPAGVKYFGIGADGVLRTYPTKEEAIEAVVGDVPITEDYFGWEAFCAYVKSFDTNADGKLSLTEREAVREMAFIFDEVQRYGKGEVRGLEWFPKLEYLQVGTATRLVIRSHPALKALYLGDHDNMADMDEIVVADCPWLKSIESCVYISGALSVRNCERLQQVVQPEVHGDFTMSLENVGRPIVFLAEGATCIADADVFIGSSESGRWSGAWKPDFLGRNQISRDGGSVSLELFETVAGKEHLAVRWNNMSYNGLLPTEDFPLSCFSEKEFADFCSMELVRDEEAPEDGLYHYKCLVTYEKEIVRQQTFSFTSTVLLYPKDIYVKPDDIQKMEVYAYSPKRGALLWMRTRLSLYYHGADGDVKLGTIDNTFERYVGITVDLNNGRESAAIYEDEESLWNAFGLEKPLHWWNIRK